jgi:hypothetical protein
MFTAQRNLYQYLISQQFGTEGTTCAITEGGGGKVFVHIYNLDKLDDGDDSAQCQITFVPHKTGGWAMMRERPCYTVAHELFKTLIECSANVACIVRIINK